MGVAILLTIASCSAPEARVVELVVPAGTNARLVAGDTVDILPRELTFRVGDTLRIRNDDSVAQEVGPYFVAAGVEFEVTYGMPGRFEGVCPLSGGEPYVIVITD
ncbi:MAG TPA: hypothetical protein VLB67_07865 [Acidimicrobiia bacterium]|nr:hypothetical protein [Acidimicrobiia bacterium]